MVHSFLSAIPPTLLLLSKILLLLLLLLLLMMMMMRSLDILSTSITLPNNHSSSLSHSRIHCLTSSATTKLITTIQVIVTRTIPLVEIPGLWNGRLIIIIIHSRKVKFIKPPSTVGVPRCIHVEGSVAVGKQAQGREGRDGSSSSSNLDGRGGGGALLLLLHDGALEVDPCFFYWSCLADIMSRVGDNGGNWSEWRRRRRVGDPDGSWSD